MQLREKQKVKRIYGIMERQFRNYFRQAARSKGITGELLLQFLERRLDNIVYRLGFAGSRNQARQFVRHGHLLVNGRRVNIPSFQVKQGDEVAIKPGSRKNVFVLSSLEEVVGRGVPEWLELQPQEFMGRVLDLPSRENISIPIEEQLIVELYSK
jgi:small subunit ribosomal protein S4